MNEKIRRQEKGSAYLAVFLTMVLVLTLAGGAYFSARMEMLSTRWKKKDIAAEYIAEAGLREVLYRLSLRDQPDLPAGAGGSKAIVDGGTLNAFIGENAVDASNPDAGWQMTVLSCALSALPPASPPRFYTVSLQGTPRELPYTTADPGEDALDVSYLKDRWDADGDGDRAEVIFYDPFLPLDGIDNMNSLLFGGDGISDNESPLNVRAPGFMHSGLPALSIRSTGIREGGRVTMEGVAVRKETVRPMMGAALTAGISVTGTGEIFISGFNHALSVDRTGSGTCGLSYAGDGLDNNGDGADDEAEIDFPYDCAHKPFGHKAGALSQNVNGPAGSVVGAPWASAGESPIPPVWASLGLSESLWQEVLAIGSLDTFPGDGRDGVYRLGAAGTWTFLSGTGSGLIYSPGSLELSSDFVFRGVIYAEDGIEIRGSPWICGAVLAGGMVTLEGYHPSSPLTILYSEKTITNLTRFTPFRMLGRTFEERY
jgi:hypothetical protein